MELATIDLNLFRRGGAARKRAVARELDAAARGLGMFALAGHGIPAEMVAGVRAVTREFFALPSEEKRRSASESGIVRGYFPVGSEALYRTLGRVSPPDLNESFMIGPSGPDAAANIWPSRPLRLKSAWRRFYAVMERVSVELRGLSALALGLDEDFFEASFCGHASRLRARFYPSLSVSPRRGQLRAGAHSDYVAFTLLLADAPGLQVFRDGRWNDVLHGDGRLIVNFGDLMVRWTNGRWRSPVHRVANPSQTDPGGRLSLAFFNSPNDASVIECLDACRGTAGRPRYAPVTAGAYISSRLRRASGASPRR